MREISQQEFETLNPVPGPKAMVLKRFFEHEGLLGVLSSSIVDGKWLILLLRRRDPQSAWYCVDLEVDFDDESLAVGRLQGKLATCGREPSVVVPLADTPGGRCAAAMTNAGLQMIRELQHSGFNEREITSEVVGEFFFLGSRCARAAGINRATLDAIVMRVLDRVYTEAVDNTFSTALQSRSQNWGDA